MRTRVEEISLVGRNTQGVKLMNLHGGEKLVGVEKIESIAEVEANGDLPADDDSPAVDDEGEGGEDA